ncbi:MAG TPA: hypothetical protein PLR06_12050 [Cyclobacteriaceae bacterium]|nr:hypothetical protein [Cyclobacteriaceae bacterium]
MKSISVLCIGFWIATALPTWSQTSDTTFHSQQDYRRGQGLQRQLKFDSAIIFYTRFRESQKTIQDKKVIREIEKRLRECRSGIQLVASPHNFIIRNLGPDVNSASEDYAPITNAEENILVFTSRRPENNLNPDKTPDGKYFEDIYFTRKGNSSWSTAQNIGSPVNTKYHDSNLALSANGKQLFLYTDQNEGDILVSRMINGKWSTPERLPWPVNTQYHESSVSVTADGKKLFVASERPGGRGGSDIYVFEKKSTGHPALMRRGVPAC